MSAVQMGNSNGHNQSKAQKIEALDLETKITTTHASIRAAARSLNISPPVISRYFINNKNQPYKGRYVFSSCVAAQQLKKKIDLLVFV